MNEEIAVQIENLTKIYHIYSTPLDRMKEALHPFHKRYSTDFYALQGVSMTIRKGETLGIIGKNGAGKSTLLKAITGVLMPTEGTIRVHGRIASLLELGAGFNPEMTGFENIYLNGTIMGYTREEMDKRVPNIVEFADIGDFLYQPVKTYSSGMFARLAFAVNSNVSPDILIVDEALAVGDVFFQNKCFRKLEQLRSRGTTVLFVSHDIGSVKQLCTHVLWLEKGRVVMDGAPEEVCSRYFNAEIAERNAELAGAPAAVRREELTERRADGVLAVHALPEKEGDILSEKARIISFRILDESGRETAVMEARRAYDIHVTIEAREDIASCILGITFSNPKGIDIIGTNTFTVSDGKNFPLTRDQYLDVAFSFTMPPILPGTYVWDTALAEGTQAAHVILTWLHGVSRVEVVNEASNRLGLIDVATEAALTRYTPDEIRIDRGGA